MLAFAAVTTAVITAAGLPVAATVDIGTWLVCGAVESRNSRAQRGVEYNGTERFQSNGRAEVYYARIFLYD